MMNRQLTAVLLALAASISMTGCMGKIKYPTYYTLQLAPPLDPPVQEGVRASIAIREFRSPGYLRQGPIVYKVSPEQIGFYEYHRWAEDPRDVVTNAIAERLRASGRFALVKRYDGRSDVDYVLSGRLERLEEVDYEGGVKVAIALSAVMTDLHTGATVWANSVSEVGNVDQRNVPAVVSEMNQTMARALDTLVSTSPASLASKGK